jgi:adenine-specific DNA-methyltransferase
MPTLHWVGKDKVVNHHHEVPFRVLDKVSTFTAPEGTPANTTDNRIIHGDNLEALKSLLPEFEGQVNCIYIDPPYNTGNEGWIYNDAVNDPKMKRWLGQVVGKEGEDLSRHDKWLCMMYPRLKLLHRLLADDGAIFVSIDDNEVQHLRPVLDELFGSQNRIEQFIWKKSYGGGAKERYAVTVHEYVLMYAKQKSLISGLSLPHDKAAEKRYYKLTDEKVAVRGPFRVKPLEATKSMDARENLVYPIPAPDGSMVMPKRQWWWARDRVFEALANNDLYFSKTKSDAWSIQYKQYLKDDSGEHRAAKPFSILDGPYTQAGSAALRSIFSDRPTEVFQFPKPVELIRRLLSMLPDDRNAIILDSFAGSGTTAEAVLAMNAMDGGNRRFILVEAMPYAENLTAERIRRIAGGYGETGNKVSGLGGGFDYYTVGEPMFLPDDNLNEAVGAEAIRGYVAYSEGIPAADRATTDNPHSPYLLGLNRETAWLFNYEPDRATSLDMDFLAGLRFGGDTGAGKPGTVIIYADRCLLSKDFMAKHGIIFKKIPRDITRF